MLRYKKSSDKAQLPSFSLICCCTFDGSRVAFLLNAFVCKVTFSGCVKMACSRVEIRFRPSSQEGTVTTGEGLHDPRFYFYLLIYAGKDSSPKVSKMLMVVQLN